MNKTLKGTENWNVLDLEILGFDFYLISYSLQIIFYLVIYFISNSKIVKLLQSVLNKAVKGTESLNALDLQFCGVDFPLLILPVYK